MTEKPPGDELTRDGETAPAPQTVTKRRKPFPLLFLLFVVAVAALLYVSYATQLLPEKFRLGSLSDSDRKLGPLFGRAAVENLVSSEETLRAVGRSPVDPSKVLFPVFEKTVSPENAKKGSGAPPPEKGMAAVPSDAEEKPSEPPSSSETQPTPRPTVSERSPEKETVETGQPGDLTASKQKPSGAIRRPQASAERFEDRQKLQEDPKISPNKTQAATEEPAQSDQFQLPGSLVVKIHNYTGTLPKWRVMVVFDDSASMSKKLKSWGSSRAESAAGLIGKLPEAFTPGSKLAVRDFLCSSNAKKPAAPCPSRMLFEWNDPPFKGLQEKLKGASAAGKSDPCAAAAFALKKDFAAGDGLSARVVVLTNGYTRCLSSEVLRVIEKEFGRDKVTVDVFAFGMHPKRKRGYAALVERTHGAFFAIDRPAQAEKVLARYKKILQAPIMENLEVKGEKTVVTATPDKEIALAPGTYSLVLPTVAGIKPSSRMVENIKIRSGEATLLQIKVKKGKPVAQVTKK